MKKFILISAVFLAACSQQPSYLDISRTLEEMPEAESIVKIIGRNDEYYNYNCTAASVGKGLFLTSSSCIERGMSLYGLDGKQHRPEVIKEGHSYNFNVDVINTTDENYAILYAPGLVLPPLPIADNIGHETMKAGDEYCIAYFTQKHSNYKQLNYQKITPTKVCGKAGNKNYLHRDILWGGGFEKQNGFWGAPILNSENEIVGILSYRYTDDFQRSGVLEKDVFADIVKKEIQR